VYSAVSYMLNLGVSLQLSIYDSKVCMNVHRYFIYMKIDQLTFRMLVIVEGLYFRV